MVTSDHVCDIIDTIVEDLDPSKGSVLTNSFRVLKSISDLELDFLDIYLVTSGKNRESATDTYLAGNNVYIASINEFAKEFRRQFEFMFFDLNGICHEDLDLLSEVITHGAKDGCTVCFISSCHGVGDRSIEEIKQITEDIANVHCPNRLDVSEEIFTKRFNTYANSAIPRSVATPWIPVSKKEEVSNKSPRLLLPSSLLPPVEGGETPFFGIQNHATLCFMMKYLATVCIKTRSFPVPTSFFLINDDKQSIGFAYVVKIYRGSGTLDQRRYTSRCNEIVNHDEPVMFMSIGDNSFEKINKVLTKTTTEAEKALLIKPMVSSIGRDLDVLLLEQKWYEKLKTTLETCADQDRVKQIMGEIRAWIAERGGKETTSPADLQAKFSEYPELSEFVSLIGDMSGDKKS